MICQRSTDGQKRKQALAVDLVCICTNYHLSSMHAVDPIKNDLLGVSTHALLDAYDMSSLQKDSDRGISNLENLV